MARYLLMCSRCYSTWHSDTKDRACKNCVSMDVYIVRDNEFMKGFYTPNKIDLPLQKVVIPVAIAIAIAIILSLVVGLTAKSTSESNKIPVEQESWEDNW